MIQDNIDIEIATNNLELIKNINIAAQKLNKKANIHIKVDTGMSRLGLRPEEVIPFILVLQKDFPDIQIAAFLPIYVIKTKKN